LLLEWGKRLLGLECNSPTQNGTSSPVDMNVNVKQAEKDICQKIKFEEQELRKKYGFLKYQDFLGGSIFIGSLLAIILSWYYYFHHKDEPFTLFLVVVSIMFFTSLLHELEHDLIHNLYFKKSIIQDVMFFFIWISKLHSNPWFRRDLHLKHHVVSGQKDDAEERLLGLGLPWSWKRIATTIHPFGALIVSADVAKDATWLDVQKLNLTSLPIAFVFFGLNKALFIYWISFALFGSNYSNYLPARYWPMVLDLNLLLCLPNILRQLCIVALSTSSHYYGDLPVKSVFFQNQILDHWIFVPFQLFAFNFGLFSFLSSHPLILS
jgi:fatty acid desaturase